MLVVSLVPMLVATTWGLMTIKSMQSDYAEQKNLDALTKFGDQLSAFFKDRVDNYNIQIVEQGVSSVTDEQQHFILKEIVNIDQYIKEASIIGLNGQEINKMVRGANDVVETATNYFGDELFTVAKSGKNYFGEVTMTNGDRFLTVGAPIYSAAKNTIGVLRVVMSLTVVEDMMKSVQIPQTQVMILDRDYKVILASGDLSQAQGSVWLTDRSLLEQLLKKGRLNYSDAQKGAMSAARSNISDVDWTVVVTWPQSQSGSLVSKYSAQITVVALLFLVVLTVGSIIFTKRISDPLMKLADGAQIMSGGNYKYRVQVPTGDELQQIGESLNHLAETLESSSKK